MSMLAGRLRGDETTGHALMRVSWIGVFWRACLLDIACIFGIFLLYLRSS